MENCIFCKIANGEIPAATLYEDENFRVILDLGPASKGHALILPKSHAANIYELSDEMAAKAMILAKKMATAMTAALKCDGFNILQNNGECAGQTVFHFHMHLIPRYKGDQVGITWHPGELNDAERRPVFDNNRQGQGPPRVRRRICNGIQILNRRQRKSDCIKSIDNCRGKTKGCAS